MNWDVMDVKIIGAHRLKVHFRDGIEGIVEFLPTSFRGVFAPLADCKAFEQVSINDGVLVWPQDLDLAPDAMYQEIAAHGKWILD
jgi:hypothetical protein